MPRIVSQNANASLYFNGSSAKMTVPVVPDPTGWCLAMWIEPGDKGTPTHTYVSYNSAAFTDGIFISKNAGSGNININVYNGTGAVYANTLLAPASQWIHIAVTYLPNGTCKTYKNGVLLSSATSSGTMTAAAAQLLTFNSRSFTNYFAQSTMSNIVWQNTTTSWTDDQVRDIYQTNKLPAGTTMYLALGEGAGSIAYDTSGNANNGTITSPTWTRETFTRTRNAVNGNLVYNGDFEIAPVVNVAQTSGSNYVDGTATGATIPIFGYRVGTRLGTATVQFDTVIKRTGNASIKLSTLAVASDMAVGATMSTTAGGLQIGYPALPSTSYTASVWVKTNYVSGASTSGVRATVVEKNGIGSSGTTNVLLTALQTTQDWTQYNLVFTTASTTRSLLFLINVKGDDGTATLIMDAWFDDITLTPTTATTRTANTFPQRKTSDNLLSNGNFEYAPPFTAATTTVNRWIDGTATGNTASVGQYGWAFSFSTGTASASFDNAVSRSGSKSLRLSTLDASGTAIATQSLAASVPTTAETGTTITPVLPSTSYTLTLWAKTSNAATNSVYADIREFTGARVSAVTTATNKLSGTNDWTQLTVTVTTSVNTRFIGIVLRNAVPGNVSDAWFDDITLTKVPANARTVVS
jgi:hypothetical protein